MGQALCGTLTARTHVAVGLRDLCVIACRYADHGGQNKLGRVLERVRDELLERARRLNSAAKAAAKPLRRARVSTARIQASPLLRSTESVRVML